MCLTGSEFAQTLVGSAGNNILNGGFGNDVVTGGTGLDSFVFNTALSATTNADTITDFSHADDTIRLSKSVFTALTQAPNTLLTPGALADWTAAGQTDDRILYRHLDSADADTAKDVVLLYSDANGGSRSDAVLFGRLQNQPSVALDQSDFLIVA